MSDDIIGSTGTLYDQGASFVRVTTTGVITITDRPTNFKGLTLDRPGPSSTTAIYNGTTIAGETVALIDTGGGLRQKRIFDVVLSGGLTIEVDDGGGSPPDITIMYM